MTKEEIYEHLAKVYLGKKKKPKRKRRILIKGLIIANALLVISALALIITRWDSLTQTRIPSTENLLSLNLGNYPLRLNYNFTENKPQKQNFTMFLPNLDLRKFDSLMFSIRSFDGKIPKLLKIGLENKKKETSRVYLSDITAKWQTVTIPLDDFQQITDWSTITKISFIFEAWNLNSRDGKVLIDDVSFILNKRR